MHAHNTYSKVVPLWRPRAVTIFANQSLLLTEWPCYWIKDVALCIYLCVCSSISLSFSINIALTFDGEVCPAGPASSLVGGPHAVLISILPIHILHQQHMHITLCEHLILPAVTQWPCALVPEVEHVFMYIKKKNCDT